MCSFRFPSCNRFRRIVESSNPVESFRGAFPPGRQKKRTANTFARCSGNRKIEKFTLPKLNSSPMKNDGWKLEEDPFPTLGFGIFSVRRTVRSTFQGGKLCSKKSFCHLQNDGLGRRIWGGRNFSEGGTVKSHRYWMSCQDGCRKDGIFRNDLRQGIPSWRSLAFFWGCEK